MLSVSEALDRAQMLCAAATKAGADAADALYYCNAATSVSMRLGALEDVERSEGQDISLRVFVGQRSASVIRADRLASAASRGRSPEAAAQSFTRLPISGKRLSAGSVRSAGPEKPPRISMRGRAGNCPTTRPRREAHKTRPGKGSISGSLAPSTARQAAAMRSSAAPWARASATSAAVEAPAPPPGGMFSRSTAGLARSIPSARRNRAARPKPSTRPSG